MPALLLLMFISSFVDHSQAAGKPWVTLDPNWKKIFKKSSMTLTCNIKVTGWKEPDYKWYRNNHQVHAYQRTVTIGYAEEKYSGAYQCATTDSERSDPVRLDVSNEWLILQAPPYVYEGDTLTLRCHGWNDKFKEYSSFYQDNSPIPSTNSILRLENVTRRASGNYRCTRERWNGFYHSKESDKTFVSVHELFKSPEIRKLPAKPVTEGAEVRLQCVTTTYTGNRLLYTFYKGSQTIQGAITDSNYVIPRAGEEHTGNYKCSVQTTDGNVQKNSPDLHLLTSPEQDFACHIRPNVQIYMSHDSSPEYQSPLNVLVNLVREDGEFR
ncbi:high affinity immunoglobulin gamma Fc receptor I-like [Mixophyes fleayi]|uniref:high affinity immunoglobulin gamma Fc receptor I-like n=1 Tax=Mixophyes fleayi TaxID=3061075 RepID=UPI003F4E1FEE